MLVPPEPAGTDRRRLRVVPRVAPPPPARHILLGVSHPTDDPMRHRIFEIRAIYDAATRGWVAQVGEQDRNEQRGAWDPLLTPDGVTPVFPTAAACLGAAVAILIATVDADAHDA